jgi:hypothetical protein
LFELKSSSVDVPMTASRSGRRKVVFDGVPTKLARFNMEQL